MSPKQLWHKPIFRQAPYGFAEEALTEYEWDALTLQPFGEIEAEEVEYCAKYIELALPKSPGIQSYLYAQWPRKSSGNYEAQWLGPAEADVRRGAVCRDRFENITRDLAEALPAEAKAPLILPVGHALYRLDQKIRAGQLPGYESIHCHPITRKNRFERLGMWDRMLALFFADHGDMMGSHQLLKKGTLPYDELYRIPCIFKPHAGMVSRRAVIDDLVGSYSLAGTLLKLAGVPVPETFTEGDFADAFRRDRHPENEAVFFEHYAAYWGIHPFYGVRTRNHKYVCYYGEDQAEEMYDLVQDPYELTNIAQDPKRRELKRCLAHMADEWWKRTDGRDFAYYESDFFRNDQHHRGRNSPSVQCRDTLA